MFNFTGFNPIIFNTKNNLKYFSVPTFQPNRGLWIEAIEKFQTFDYKVQTFHVCSEHFLPTDIVVRGKKKTVIPGRVPSLFANINNNNQENEQIERGINADSNNQPTQNLPSGVNDSNHENDQSMTQNAPNVAANNNYHVDYFATDFGDDNIQTTSNSIWPSEQIGSAMNSDG